MHELLDQSLEMPQRAGSGTSNTALRSTETVDSHRTETVPLEIKATIEKSTSNVWQSLCLLMNDEHGEKRSLDGNITSIRLQTLQKTADLLLQEDGLLWTQRIEWCNTPDDFRRIFRVLRIPGEQFKNSSWLILHSKKSQDEGGIGRPFSGLQNAIRERFKSFPVFSAWMDGKDSPEQSWPKKVADCASREDFLKLFTSIGIPDDLWKSCHWLEKVSKNPSEHGGIGKNLAALAHALREDERFQSFPQFIAWMDGKEKADGSMTKRVAACITRNDFLNLFLSLGISDGKWRNAIWLSGEANLSPAEGGVGRSLQVLYKALRDDERFGSFQKFIAWIDEQEEPPPNTTERVNACKTPEDLLKFFMELEIPDQKWRNSHWLAKVAKLPREEGGICRPLEGVARAVRKRFGSHACFLAWMDRKEKPEEPLTKVVQSLLNPEQFRQWFESLGISESQWRSSQKLQKGVENEVGSKKFIGVYSAIVSDERFKSYPQFVAWMDGKDKPDQTLAEKVAACKNPDDFLHLFSTLGIPGDKWKSYEWIANGSKLTVEEDGINKDMQPLLRVLSNQFKGFRKFLCWMDGSVHVNFTQAVKEKITPEQFIEWFVELGIPDNKWTNSSWLSKMAKLSIDEGGINKNLQALSQAICSDSRFGSFHNFLSWMGVTEQFSMRNNSERSRNVLRISDKIESLETPDDFRAYFSELGIPDEKWRNGSWLIEGASLPLEQGGIGKPLSTLMKAIREDVRFGSFRIFIAWMDGKDASGYLVRKKIQECKSRQDFLTLFNELGVPQDAWRTSTWWGNTSALPIEQGGIEKIGVTNVPTYLKEDPRFGSFPHFVAWMDGKEKPDETMVAQIRACQTQADFLSLFEKLGIPQGQWRSSTWFREKSKLPLHEGGIDKNLESVLQAIRKDERFENFTRFVAWMDGVQMPDTISIAEKVRRLNSREEYLAFFVGLGVPEKNWHDHNWMTRIARLPVNEGGIGKNLKGVVAAIAKQEKFRGSYRYFIDWLDGKIPDDPKRRKSAGEISLSDSEPIPESTLRDRVQKAFSPSDFLEWFSELGIPNDKWRSSWWLRKMAHKSAAEGGIRKRLYALPRILNEDSRFRSYPKFVAWMDGGEAIGRLYCKRLADCQLPNDALQWFKELGITDENWRNSRWLQTKARLPIEEGGICRSLGMLSIAIRQDMRFGGHRTFVAWIDGFPLEGIQSTEQARNLLEREAIRLDVQTEQLLDPDHVSTFFQKSPLLQRILAFFETNEITS